MWNVLHTKSKEHFAREGKMMTKEELLAEFAKRGIQISIGGCGCCSSPWVTVMIDGEQVFEDENVSFEIENTNYGGLV